jgi:hypothetical protein
MITYGKSAVCLAVATALLAGPGVAQEATSTARGGIRIEVTFSRQLAVLDFMKKLRPTAPDNPFKTLFANSAFSTGPLAGLTGALDSIPLDYEYRFTQYPPGLKIEGSTEYVLKRALATTATPDEFRSRAIGVIPMADLNRLVSLLEAFAPAYDSLVYLPNRETFERQLRDIDALVTSKDLAAHFERVRAFFRSDWDPSIPFLFVFYPLPNSRGFNATAYGNISECALPTSFTDFPTMLALMLHEATHILLDEQSVALKRELDDWFASSPAKSATSARSLMQESWATAIGSGYFGERLTGSLNPGNWYGERHISEMGKAFFPLVKPYLDAGTTIDRSLVNAYIGLHESRFLSWLSDWEYLMTGRFVISERQADFDLIDSRYRYRNSAYYLHDFSSESLAKLREAATTRLVVVSRDNRKTLARVQAAIPELAGWRPDASRDFTYSVMMRDKRRLIVINLVRGGLEQQLGSALSP